MNDPSLSQRCQSIELLVMDVDGVLTDGRIVYSDARRKEIRRFTCATARASSCG